MEGLKYEGNTVLQFIIVRTLRHGGLTVSQSWWLQSSRGPRDSKPSGVLPRFAGLDGPRYIFWRGPVQKPNVTSGFFLCYANFAVVFSL